MTIQIINTGTSANAGNGDSLRTAFNKINSNFSSIASLIGTTSTDFNEIAQDAVSNLFIHDNHVGITAEYNDAQNIIELTVSATTSTGTSTSYDQSLNTFDTVQFNGLTSTGTIFQGTAYDGIEYPNTSIRVDANANSFAQMIMQNHSTGSNASTDLVIMNNNGDNFNNLIDIGINSSNYESIQYGVTKPNDGYLFVNGGDLVIGTQGPGQKIIFHAGGTTANDSVAQFDQYSWQFNRRVEIAVPSPSPLRFRVQNTSDNVVAQSIFEAANDLNSIVHFGINSSHPEAQYGNISPNEAFIHTHDNTGTFHIGSENTIAFYSNLTDGFAGTPTLVMSNLDQSSTFSGHILPNSDLTYDLGSIDKQWRSLYVGTGTIYLGGVALGVNQDNYVTVDGNPIITVNTAGNITIQGDNVITPATVSDLAPSAEQEGNLWFNTVEARTYVAYNEQWVDASPAVLAPPDTNPTLESVTFNDNTTQTTAWSGTYSYNDLTDKPVTPTFVGGGGANTWLTAD